MFSRITVISAHKFSHSEIATITYRSGPEWDIRFGRKLRESSEVAGTTRVPALCPDFLIETYLDYQARPHLLLHRRFPEPNSGLRVTGRAVLSHL
jgi:homoserine acetyltransferase